MSVLVGAVAGHMASRIENEHDCDGASYLPPVESEPAVQLLQQMVNGEEEPFYSYSGTVLQTC